MSTQFQLRRGTAGQTANFIGAVGEVTVDTTSNILVLHDSVTPGGWPVLGANTTQSIYNKTLVSATLLGNTAVTGNIVPSLANTYNLGSAESPFKTLYLSGNTIYLGSASISTTQNSLVFRNPVGGIFSVVGNDPAGSTGTFGNLIANSSTASTSTTTGALVVKGGAGIAGNTFVNNIFSTNYFYSNGISIFDGLAFQIANAASAYGDTNVAFYLPNDPTIQALQANAATQANQITGANAAIITANTGMKSYVDDKISTVNSTISAANAAAVSYTDSAITNLINLAPAALDTLGEIAANLANESNIQSAIINSITNTNANVTAANTAIASLATGANANTAAYLTTATGNLSANNITATGNVTASYFIGTGSQLTGANSSNTTSGALVVDGGVGISGNLNVGGTLGQSVTIPASEKQIYVAKNGNDSNNGTINQPFLTIKAALAAATAGTSVQIAPGTYTEANPVTIPPNVSLMGDNLRSVTVIPQTPAADLFHVSNGCYVWGITIKDYSANGFSYSSATSNQNVFVSPYIQNLTSSTISDTATAVMIDGNFSSNISTKAMIVGFFTIINRGGVGVRITNSGYSQLVNIYTIGANVGIWCQSGGFCTLNGSDNSIGNIGLKAEGTGPLLSTGNTTGYSTAGVFNIANPTTPPNVNQVMVINGDPIFYNIDTISKIDNVTYQVTVLETYNGNLSPNTSVSFYQRSAIIASAHTFEYVGAGTNPATALPQYGGYPNANLKVIEAAGGRVTYTGTDEKGNFYIGSNLVINQSTGTISGDSFSKSMFSLMTPYILALSEGP